MFKIYSPTDRLMDAFDLANWANNVHQISGGKGRPFVPMMFTPHDGIINQFRLGGNHCQCGCDKKVAGNPTLGHFKLLSLSSPDVLEGGKAYMQCIKCGGFSHL